MAKRSNDFLPNTKNVKKQKLNDADETLWDDDLDDYCFDEIANKILEKVWLGIHCRVFNLS